MTHSDRTIKSSFTYEQVFLHICVSVAYEQVFLHICMSVAYEQVFLHICMRVAIGMSTTSPELLGVRACPKVSDLASA